MLTVFVWFGTVALLSVVLTLIVQQELRKWRERHLRKQWEQAGGQWMDALNSIDAGVQSMRRNGPSAEVVLKLRKEFDRMDREGMLEMRLPEHEMAEHRERIERQEQAATAVDEQRKADNQQRQDQQEDDCGPPARPAQDYFNIKLA